MASFRFVIRSWIPIGDIPVKTKYRYEIKLGISLYNAFPIVIFQLHQDHPEYDSKIKYNREFLNNFKSDTHACKILAQRVEDMCLKMKSNEL